MKVTNSFLAIRKFIFGLVSLCFVIAVFSEMTYGMQVSLPGGQSIELDVPLTGEMKNRFGEGWSKASFIGKDRQRLQLFSEENLTEHGGIVFEDLDQRNISVSGNFFVLQVVRQGTLENAGEKPRVEGREYCPVVEATTGCIVTMQTGEICGGGWSSKGDRWIDASVDRTSEMTERTTSGADELWKEFLNSSVHLKLRDVITSNMGISNVMACDPLGDANRKSYLAIAGQLKIEKANSQAAYIESKLTESAVKSTQLNGERLGVSVDRAWLYDRPNVDAKTRMYLVRGDIVTVVESNNSGFTHVEYSEKSGHVLRKWIRTDCVKRVGVN
ncbi:hypothetical protein [Paraburkholderia sp. J76]|uniref:hypothetical protein n=1 Tax=Paraburkholderia sp. J76 TaxID=2805439 RepID=UPI002ABD3046|nr:hypothetical protein [Paraburkholderia sp. J76]